MENQVRNGTYRDRGQSPGCKEPGCSGFHVLTMINRSDRQSVPISPDSPKAEGRGEAVCCGKGKAACPDHSELCGHLSTPAMTTGT